MDPIVEDELNALFSWNPPRLLLREDHTTSKGSRDSGPFARHLNKALALKHVKILPSLLDVLCQSVDTTLADLRKQDIQLPPAVRHDGLPRIRDALATMSVSMRNEADVVMFHASTTSSFCVPVAATLILHPSFSRWTSMGLHWSTTPSGPNHAIADSSLRVDCDRTLSLLMGSSKPETEDEEDLLVSMSGIKDDYLLVAKWCPDIVSFEAKSLRVAPRGVMENIQKLANDFLFNRQAAETKEMTLGRNNQLYPPDALDTPWSLADAISYDQYRLRQFPEESLEEEGPETTARKFVQQAWAQAVRNDTTLFVLHSGNYEFICVRHRASQTMYLSPLITAYATKNPGYGKIHVGLYITALQDAIKRARLMSARASTGTNGRRGQNAGHSRDNVHNRGVHKLKRRRTVRRDTESGKMVGASSREATVSRDHSVVQKRTRLLVSFRFGIYDSPSPALFLRTEKKSLHHDDLSESGPHNAQDQNHTGILTITSQIGQGATGIVHGATMICETTDGHKITKEVVVKMALEDDQRERLWNEYNTYGHLARNGIVDGVPSVIGLFREEDDGMIALIMTHAGVALNNTSEALSDSTRAMFLSTLKSIHDAGVVHGDLRPENLLVNKAGKSSIIDFDQAEKSCSPRAAQRECKMLSCILNDPKKCIRSDEGETMTQVKSTLTGSRIKHPTARFHIGINRQQPRILAALQHRPTFVQESLSRRPRRASFHSSACEAMRGWTAPSMSASPLTILATPTSIPSPSANSQRKFIHGAVACIRPISRNRLSALLFFAFAL